MKRVLTAMILTLGALANFAQNCLSTPDLTHCKFVSSQGDNQVLNSLSGYLTGADQEDGIAALQPVYNSCPTAPRFSAIVRQIKLWVA